MNQTLVKSLAYFSVGYELKNGSQAECVPICFRKDSHSILEITDHRRLFIHAEIESVAFEGTVLIAYSDTLEDYGNCDLADIDHYKTSRFGGSNRQNEGAEYAQTMNRAAKEILGQHPDDEPLGKLTEVSDYNEHQLNFVTIAYGLGNLAYLNRETFPNAVIDAIDIDEALFTISREWFCWDTMMIENRNLNLMTYDGIQYMLELQEDPSMKQYDVINIDAYNSSNIVPFFESEEFFRLVQDLWNNWDESNRTTRVLVMNAYYKGNIPMTNTTAYRNAIKVFGVDKVKKHSTVVFSITSN